jgi:hypothetical protein
MTAPSVNPRRFSRGEENLDPTAHMRVWMSFAAVNESGAVARVETAIERHLKQYPQAQAHIMALQVTDTHVSVVLEVDLGPIRSALLGKSIEVKAGYGLLRACAKHLFYLHPIFVVEPSDSDRDMYEMHLGKVGV